MDAEQISSKRLKSFVRHLSVIAKKHKDREEARAELEKQMERLRRFTSKKKEMDEELGELSRKVSLVLEKEAQLLGIKQGESAASRELMQRVIENRESVKQLNNSINEVRGLLERYIHIKTEREKRIDELEERIRAKTKQRKEVIILKNKLRKLEELYNKMKRKGVDVSSIKGRIEGLRLRLG